MSEKIDIILFGATGFTGSYCIESLHKLTKANGRSLSWGIAGRSEKKLKDALKEYQKKIAGDLPSVPIIVADINDFDSLKSMTARAKVIVNCCGPYRFYGEPVIKACIETGTHQVDVTGEPLYMETILYKYQKAAQEKGIYIVSACGFDSIPADFGVLFMQSKFEGTINSIESYLQLFGDSNGLSANFATYESAVHGVGTANELGPLRRKLYPTPLPKFQPKLEHRSSIHKSDLINSWSVPFIGSDRSVIQRTQRYLYDSKKVRPVQIQTYLGIQSISNLMLMVILGALFGFMARFSFGRSLLLKYPSFFTAGLFKHEQPSKEDHAKSKFAITLKAVGWNEKLADVTDNFKTPPNKTMVARVSGGDPGYGLTSNLVVLSAIVILTDTSKLPQRSGVYTPGSAFAETSFMEMVQENGLKLELL